MARESGERDMERVGGERERCKGEKRVSKLEC